MFLYIKTNILRGYGIFKNDFAHPREPANEPAYNIIPILNLVYQTKHTNHTEVHSSLPIRSLDMKLTIK